MSGKSRAISRRAFTGLALAGAFAPFHARASDHEPRFVTPDHGLAQTLISIGADLAGIAQIPNWNVWTIEPALPPDVVNLGTAREMNLELLQRLQPNLIVSTPYLEGVRHQLERIAPVLSFPIHALGTSPYPNILAATRRLGALSGRNICSRQHVRSSRG